MIHSLDFWTPNVVLGSWRCVEWFQTVQLTASHALTDLWFQRTIFFGFHSRQGSCCCFGDGRGWTICSCGATISGGNSVGFTHDVQVWFSLFGKCCLWLLVKQTNKHTQKALLNLATGRSTAPDNNYLGKNCLAGMEIKTKVIGSCNHLQK